MGTSSRLNIIPLGREVRAVEWMAPTPVAVIIFAALPQFTPPPAIIVMALSQRSTSL